MDGKRIIAICQSGGEFQTNEDGLLSYKGGDAHAMEIDGNMEFKDLKLEVAEMFNFNQDTVAIKYFIPGNKKTLISISNEKDLKRMIKFHDDCGTAEIYVMTEEVAVPDASYMPGSRSSRTTISESGVPADASPTMIDVVDDINKPDILLDSTFDVVGDTNNDDGLTNVPTEMPLPISFAAAYDEKQSKAAQQWQNNITGVGQRFNSVHEFREALRKYAIAHQFAFKYKKNDSHRVTVKCKAEGCPWRIHASRLSTTPLICIKKMHSTHTCEGSAVTTGYQATRSWVASIIKEKLKVFPNYKPKDIVNDIKQEYGVQLNYFQAWRGKEIAKEQLQGSYKEAYSQLPFFCEKIMETNPGSLATFTTKEDSSFHCLFVAFHASLNGFEQGCRPLLFLDSIFLKSKYQGSLLAATAADGDDGFFPVAFAIVDTESEDNWRWFLQQLKVALSSCHGLTFVADREKGLRESIAEIFHGEDVFHGFCLRYLSEQLVRDLKGQFTHEVKRLLVEDFYSAAHAPSHEGFQNCVENIKHISLEAYNWIMQSEPVHWANAYFQGARYNHMASKFGELFYSWVSDAHELPITQMVDTIRSKIMELMYSRRAESIEWLSRLTPSMEEKLDKENLKVRTLQVLISGGNRFEVRGDTVEAVDVDNWDCTCKYWQLTGLPCCHAIAVIGCLGRDPHDYCSRYFTTESYRITYSDSVNPISNVDGPPHEKQKAGMAASFPFLHKSPFLGETNFPKSPLKIPLKFRKSPNPNPTASFKLSEILGGRGLCNGEEGLQKELTKPTPEQPSPIIPNQAPSLENPPIPESSGDGFEKELMGLTGGFPGGERGLRKFIEENPPPPRAPSAVFDRTKPPELPLLLPGMIAIVKNPNNPFYMYCGIVQRITDGKAGVLFEGGNWDRLVTFRLEELERRAKGPPMVNPRSAILEEIVAKD